MSTNDASDKFIVFTLAGTQYGLRSRDVQHVEMVEAVTPVPNAAPFVEGIVFSRGAVVPVINLRVRFGFERAPLDLRTRLLVVGDETRRIGLLVDSAREFMTIPAAAIQPPHEAITALSGRYLEGVATLGQRIVLVLKLDDVLAFAPDAIEDQAPPAAENRQ
ncbi:MAG: chemotaxis protein CheW [Bacteroidales bacterium]